MNIGKIWRYKIDKKQIPDLEFFGRLILNFGVPELGHDFFVVGGGVMIIGWKGGRGVVSLHDYKIDTPT